MNKPIHPDELRSARGFRFDPSRGPFDYSDGKSVAKAVMLGLAIEALIAFGVFVAVALNGHAIFGALL